jgi:hypothetical protein
MDDNKWDSSVIFKKSIQSKLLPNRRNFAQSGHPKADRHLAQGDQIGGFFAGWAIVYFGQIYTSSQNYRLNFLQWEKLCNDFDTKMGWATFWVIFFHRLGSML